MFDEWYKVAKRFAKQEITIGTREFLALLDRNDDPLHR